MDVARNIEGRWLYVADHASMPLPSGDSAPLDASELKKRGIATICAADKGLAYCDWLD